MRRKSDGSIGAGFGKFHKNTPLSLSLAVKIVEKIPIVVNPQRSIIVPGAKTEKCAVFHAVKVSSRSVLIKLSNPISFL